MLHALFMQASALFCTFKVKMKRRSAVSAPRDSAAGWFFRHRPKRPKIHGSGFNFTAHFSSCGSIKLTAFKLVEIFCVAACSTAGGLVSWIHDITLHR